MTATLQQLFTTYEGSSIPSFDGNPANDGQCEQWALMVRTQRDGLPVRAGNAIDWWLNRGSDTQYFDYITYASGVFPKAGDYVVWGTGVGSSAGHIDVCAADGDSNGFAGYDSNWEDIPTLREIQHGYRFGILGYVRKKGINNMLDQNGIVSMFQLGFGRSPSSGEIAQWVGKDYHLLQAAIQANNSQQQNAIANFDNVLAQLTAAQAEIQQLGKPTPLKSGTVYIAP